LKDREKKGKQIFKFSLVICCRQCRDGPPELKTLLNFGTFNVLSMGVHQWRSQKFGFGGAVGQFWLKSLTNTVILYIKLYFI